MELTTFFNLLTTVGVLFFIMATGFLARRIGVMDTVASHRFSALIIKIAQPLMIIGALISKPFDTGLLKEGLVYLAIGFLLHPFLWLLSLLFRPLLGGAEEQKIGQFALIFTNCAFIGFPILETVFPGKGPFLGAFFVIGFHVYIWTLGIFILSRGRDDIKLTPKKALINFGTVPCAVGVLLYFTQALFPMPDLAVQFTSYMSHLCMPIAVLITGAQLATQRPRAILTNKHLYLFNVLKLLLTPVLVCLVAKLVTMGLDNSYQIVMFCTVISALPSATTISMLSELYDINPSYASQTVGSSSVLSVATLPLMYFIGDLVARL